MRVYGSSGKTGGLSLLSRLCVPLFGVLIVSSAFAQGSEESKTPGVDAGIDLEVRYDDNIFRSATGVTSSWIPMLAPNLSFVAKSSRYRYELEYDGELAWFTDSSPDDYDDHRFGAGAYFKLGEKGELDFVGSYDQAHERRGTGLTEGFIPQLNIPESPDEYDRAKVLSRFAYGSGQSIGRVVMEAGYRDLEYTTNQARTHFSDRSDVYGDATLYIKVKSKTSLLLALTGTDINYKYDRPSGSSLDSIERRYLMGVTWETTAKTRGSVKVGYIDKTFDDQARADFSETSWDVDVRWSPRSYSHLDFRTARYPSETNGGGNFVDNTSYSVDWTHKWRSRFESVVSALALDQDYVGSFNGRQQDLTQFGLTINYEMKQWLQWRIGVEGNSRDSNIDRFAFDGTVYSIAASIML